ncbi:MAG: creatininase family protein [Candidatus Riflebacteria bacterium]|nr:creatininase family protein [Candidatus Riflebacteria bacterium]
MRLDELTWPECRDYVERSGQLLLPIGTCEQHGPHLPLATDTLVAEHVADWLSSETGILVAPTVSYGVNLPCDRLFWGTSSVTPEAFRTYVAEVLSWWRDQGFRRFHLISSHGDPLHLEALRSLERPDVRVRDLWEMDLSDLLEAQEGAGHACEAATSVMLALFPDKVRLNEVVDFETPWEEFAPYLRHERTDPVPGSPGQQGFPRKATAWKGQAIVRRIKTRALAWLLSP